ncbi:MAG: hypothetical protein IIW23_03210, partial [Clostridia bacterium]|nr:hypothetical protein [Clostridia bacterium]
ITKDYYAGSLAEKYGVSKAALMSESDRIAALRAKNRAKKEQQRAISPAAAGNDEDSRQRAKNLRAAKAEDNLIAVLMAHPDLYEKVKDNLPESLITDLNGIVYAEVIRQLGEGREFDITDAASRFDPKQAGHAVRLMNDKVAASGHRQTLEDSIKVIAEEKSLAQTANAEDMTDAEWANMIQNIANKKREG